MLTGQYEARARVPVDFHLDVCVREVGCRGRAAPTILTANNHLHAVREAKGHAFDYVEFNGGHDYVC